jgi:hypothetical protein
MKKLNGTVCILLFSMSFINLAVSAQNNQLLSGGIPEKISSFFGSHTQERAYLQFDKPYYAIGDTIYFKAYVTIGAQHKLSALSSILYVELIDPDNKIARSLKLQMITGVAWGDFALTDTLKGGNYSVRAYTNWMRNEGESTFFEQTFPVGSAVATRILESGQQKNKKATASITAKKFDVQFLPEGGSLVVSNYSKIAFKAIGPGGFGIDIKGTVTDETGAEICSLASTHLGTGTFNIVPEAGKNYKANITYPDGSIGAIELPKAIHNGYTISLNNSSPDTLRIRITAGSEATGGKLSLVAQSGGVVYYAAEKQGDSKIFSATIPKSKFPTGIIQFTLFSQNGEPLNERLAFINHHDQLNLNLKTDKPDYAIRQKVKFKLNPKDKDGKPVTGSFSVAVTDETKVPVDTLNENGILTNLLLTSELKGNIEQPEYYFTNIDPKAQTDLDNLMLTQGYRHFEWKKVLTDTTSTNVYQPEKAMRVSGTVKRNGKPVPNAQVKLFSKAGGMFMLDTLTDVNGKFAFKDLIFADSTKFVVQSKVKKGQDDVTLELDTIQPPRVIINNFGSGKYMQTSVSVADISAYVINQKQFYEEQQKYGINKHPIVLKEVKVETKYEPKIPHSENLNGAGNADYVFTSKDIEKFNCARLAECLSGRLPGLRFRNGIPESMAVVIDGNFIDVDLFTSINPDDIEGIEIIRKSSHYATIYGTRMADGGIIITTKRGKRTKDYYRYAPGVVTYMPKGFYKAREFYSPQYDNPHTNQKMADLRSTIYWNPNIITDKDGKASFEYFNADGKGTYRVVVEGIDADGNLGRQVFRYKVE